MVSKAVVKNIGDPKFKRAGQTVQSKLKTKEWAEKGDASPVTIADYGEPWHLSYVLVLCWMSDKPPHCSLLSRRHTHLKYFRQDTLRLHIRTLLPFRAYTSL